MTETMGGDLALQALALVAAPSETGREHPAIDLIASWLAPARSRRSGGDGPATS